ncbi:Prephenate dehydratase [Lachnospiraceae bacterium]|nr:Prephenate dehydratase [Lachnospiraceae bacterium]
MKRFLALVLCVTVCVSFAGCEGKGSAPAPTAQTEEMSFSDAKVSFLGPEGTYTQEACEQFFAEEGKYLPYETVGDAVKALVNGDTDYAVIPQENTIGGAVIDYVDTLIGETSVYVTGEVELPINQNLLVLPGTDVSEIKTVYSHKQGIAQGKEWLQKNVPQYDVVDRLV